MSEDVKIFLDQLDEAKTRYDQADAYYRGVPPEIMSNDIMQQFLGINPGAFKENFSAIPVDAMASRMSLNGFNVSGTEEASNFVNKLWTDSDMNLEFQGFLRDVLKYGEGILEMGFDVDEEGVSLDICPTSVLNSQVIYWAGDARVKLFLGKLDYIEKFYGAKSQEVRLVTLKYADRIERWVETGVDTNIWEPYYLVADVAEGEEEVEPSWDVNPLGEVPAYHFRNETPYGMPEHYQGYGAQDQIVKIIMNHMGVIDFAGLPERWVLLEAGAEASGAEAAGYGNPGEDPGLNINAGLSTEIPKGPGSLLLLKGAKGTGSYQAADVDQFIKSKESALRSMAVLTNTPIRFFFDPGGQHPSGEALRAADAKFRSKIENRQHLFGHVLADLLQDALRFAGFSDIQVETVWNPQVMEEDSSMWDLVEKKVNLGVPRYYAMLQAGIPAKTLQDWGLSPAEKSQFATPTDVVTE